MVKVGRQLTVLHGLADRAAGAEPVKDREVVVRFLDWFMIRRVVAVLWKDSRTHPFWRSSVQVKSRVCESENRGWESIRIESRAWVQLAICLQRKS